MKVPSCGKGFLTTRKPYQVAEEQDLHEELEREERGFEAWTTKVRLSLDDPAFAPSYEEMQ
jgi:hypothetical protein